MSAFALRCLTASLLISYCFPARPDESLRQFVKEYKAATDDSIFGDELTIQCTKTREKRGGFVKTNFKYCQKGSSRLTEESFESSDGLKVRKEDTAFSSLAIDSEVCVFLTHFPGDGEKEDDYFLESVLRDRAEISRIFSDFLPVSAPYYIREKRISSMISEPGFQLTGIERTGDDRCVIDWQLETEELGDKLTYSGEIEFDSSNGWAILSARQSVALSGKPPLYTHFLNIEYGAVEKRKLPSSISLRKVSHEGGGDTEVSTIRFDDLQYDYSKVDPSLFDLSRYGVDLPKKGTGNAVYFAIASAVIAVALIIVRKQRAKN